MAQKTLKTIDILQLIPLIRAKLIGEIRAKMKINKLKQDSLEFILESSTK